jgi:hypothetical protein
VFRNSRLLPLRLATAAVWISFGLGCKLLGLVPRHRLIVAVFVGAAWAGPLTLCIGLAETAMGLWILSGRRPRLCAAAQTSAIGVMNALELTYARPLLLAPIPMVCANAVFLAAGWYLALRGTRRGSA